MSIDEEKLANMSMAVSPCLSDSSIEALYDELDVEKTGHVTRQTIVESLLHVYASQAPSPKAYHLLHPSRASDLDAFIHGLFSDSDEPSDGYSLPQFKALVRSWNLPSIKNRGEKGSQVAPVVRETYYLQRMRTRWSMNGHRYVFVLAIVCLQLAIALWQLITFLRYGLAREAFGSGMLVAKAAAGALYPTLCLMVLSMSRWLQNLLRQSRLLRRYVDWEFAQTFHIKMACLAFALGIVHAIAHLTGTYRHALDHPEALAKMIWQRPGTPVPWSYLDFMKWRASWSGWSILGFFSIMALTGSPAIRRRYFELFQWSHLLMYPMFVMLLIHGTSAILKKPMLGWWLLLPIALVLTEKTYRLVRSFIRLEAKVLLVEDDMVALSIDVGHSILQYRPGQHIFLLVPTISRFQWHPFTVSTMSEAHITLHIRTSPGTWTGALRTLAMDGTPVSVAIDGPYGSPSREFYKYDQTIIFGAGIGITPFSAILFDLSDKLSEHQSPWKRDARGIASQHMSAERRRESCHTILSDGAETLGSGGGGDDILQVASPAATMPSSLKTEDYSHAKVAAQLHLQTLLQKRSIALHWTVRNSKDLQWLSSLLNRLTPDLSVKVDVHLYVTKPAADERLSTLVFRSLLDHRRMESIQATSFLTGLHQTCHFLRPDFDNVLNAYHHGRLLCGDGRKAKVGVIYCGPTALGRVLSRRCEILTGRARVDGSHVKYCYHSESS